MRRNPRVLFRYAIVWVIFSLATYGTLNWLLEQPWNWALIGYLTVSIIASMVAVIIGTVLAHGALSLFWLLEGKSSAHNAFLGRRDGDG